uniref:Choline transporter-like protein n=1 Tax=Branchiostoma floridae TaxID=7739 RepID=C3ZNC3_BRAFL|eukprot:XP_002589940.1 hypothetical protein BRAFLDRAFT_127837 [Branchiostoma floridae]
MSCCGGGEVHGDNRVKPFKSGEEQEVPDDFDGPLSERSCRDVFFLLLFLAFWGGMGYVTYLALVGGNMFRLLYGVDSWGNICGVKNDVIGNVSLSGQDMTSKQFLFFYDLTDVSAIFATSTDTVRLCVKSCPSENVTSLEALRTLAHNGTTVLCRYNVPITSYVADGVTCPTVPVPRASPFLNRCVPDSLTSGVDGVLSSVSDAFSANTWKTILKDIELSWKDVLILTAIGFGFSLVMTALMRFFAAFIIYLTIVVFILGSLGGTGYLWYRWHSENTADPVGQNVQTFLIAAICATVVTVLVLLLLLIMRKRIGLVVQLFQEAGKAVARMPLLLLQPVWTTIATILFGAYWVVIFLYIYTAGTPVVQSNGYVTFQTDSLLEKLVWYHVFGGLWMLQFLIGCQHVTIAGAVATWFFTRNKKKMQSPISKSMGRLIRYHLGSVAFGAMIIALVQLARIILAYIQNRLKGRAGEVADFCLRCLACCLWCFEKVLKFINRNAYIMIAIYGYNFCKSAQRAFSVLVSNALRVAALNSIGDFCLFLGKVAVVAATVVVGIELLQNRADLTYYPVPIVLGAISAFLIAHCFFTVYEMAIDTIFLCFCEDEERNDGVTKPYYSSVGLRDYLQKQERAIRAKQSKKQQKQQQQQQQQGYDNDGYE